MKIFTLGSINMDLVVSTETMPKEGETVIGSNFLTNPGGKGANQAVAVSKLGSESYMIGCVGEAFGDELIKTLNSYNVKTDYVKKLDNVSSGIAVIIINNKNNRIIIDSGSNGLIKDEYIDEALTGASENDFMISQLEIKEERVLYGFKNAKQKGMKTLLNPSPVAKINNEIFEYTDYIIVNEVEAEYYSGVKVTKDDMESINKCVDVFNKLGVKNVIITLGSDGSIGTFENEQIYIPSEKINVVDTTAAGDTYLGAFTSSISKGMSNKESMVMATKAASLTCQRMGAQKSIPYLNEIK